ncbi:MAG: helix-turn-helix domain-containing protein [Candidatus Thermoplasmatota archaeon]
MKIPKKEGNITCKDAIKCIFNLNNLDIKVYQKLKKNKNTRADKLAEILQKERSTVYRSLQKLNKCGLCIKKTKTIKKGGYFHEYKTENIEKIKEEAQKCLDEWYQTMKNKIKKLD